jgi:hypothetical protein
METFLASNCKDLNYRSRLGPIEKGEFAMKGCMILSFIVAVLVAPVQVQAQTSNPQPLNINGNVFDPMPSPGYGTPATKAKPARHVRKHRVRSST